MAAEAVIGEAAFASFKICFKNRNPPTEMSGRAMAPPKPSVVLQASSLMGGSTALPKAVGCA
jgi:hypothetical protein